MFTQHTTASGSHNQEECQMEPPAKYEIESYIGCWIPLEVFGVWY